MRILMLLLLALPLAAQSPPGPADLVRQFLALDNNQSQQFAELLQRRNDALAPLAQQLEQAQRQFQQLLAAGDADPTALGKQILLMVGLNRQLGAVFESAQKDLAALLTEEQKQKVGLVALAAKLMPIVPAFVELRFVAPPDAGPQSNAPQPAVIRLPQ